MDLEVSVEEGEIRHEDLQLYTWQDRKVVSRHRLRRIENLLVGGLAVASLAVVLYPVLNILFLFGYRGALAISIPTLVQTTEEGGLANSIVGTLLLTALSGLIAVPVGVLGGIYLAEFSGRSKTGDIIRFVADVLAGFPSIIIGYLGFLVLIIYFHWGLGSGGSVLAGALTLAILMLPYILRTTEISLRKVPQTLREAAVALGSNKTKMINKLTFSLALPGIITGILLSLSISIGEFAPLLYTVGNSDKYVSCLTDCPTSYLTYIIWIFVRSANTNNPGLAYVSALLLMLLVMSLNVVARVGLRRLSRV